MTTTSISTAGRPASRKIFRIVRPRTIIYSGMIAVVGAIMLYALLTRTLLDVNVLHDRNPRRRQAERRLGPQRLYRAAAQQARL